MRISLRNVVIFTSLSLFVCITFVLHRSIDVGPLQKISLSQNEKISLEKVEEKLRKVEDQIATNNVVMQKMRDKLRREMEIIRNSKQLTGEEKDGQLMIEDNEKGVLLPPKRREQIVREAQNEQKAIERAQDEEQARRGVIPMPPESFAEVGNNLKQGGKAAVVHSQLHRTPVNTIYHANKNFCASQMNITRPSDDIQMLDVYEKLSFEDRDGGVWKQGFDISYSSAEVKRQPTLEVIVVPHSHNDPGWIRTFEEYFHMQTKDILDLMLKHLNSQDSMRFIYAEISFFELWWRYLNDQQRAGVKTLLENGRLEIVTGGWVMTDEANSHYFAIITELFEGHEWLKNNIGSDHRPKTHWSIDPFGLSPTVAYLMNRANVSNAVVQRVHYSVKKFLAETKQLEFRWRQLFAGESSDTDIITQVMPFFSYDVPHTCGPDPAICCQFDFRRLPKRDIACPWKLPPVLIDDANVAERSAMLYDQYRKKAQLFKYNVVLVPLGDDFRYDKDFEWIDQYSNYKKLFDYMNTRKDWNVNVRFGTLSDYFGILNRRISEQVTEKPQLPVLSGDFFTYADRNDHYWSGYYTSRPFYKRMDRVAQHFLRSAELLYSFSSVSSKWMSNYFDLLVEARRHVSLFQHHDGVTGTAKDAVVVDYGKKLLNAIQNCEKIITTATAALMSDNSESSQLSFITTDEKRVQHDVLPVKVTITNQSDIVLFNPLAQERNEVVCLYVNSSDTKIQYISSPIVPIEQQIGPVLHRADFTILVSDDEYELCFVASLPGFGMRRYRLTHGGSDIRKAKILSSPGFAVHAGSFDISTVSDPEYMMRNEHVEARFDAVTGLLKSVKVEGREEMDTKISFVTYGARARNKAKFPTGGDSLSGAYLFLPDGPSKPIRLDNSYIIVEGPLCKKISTLCNKEIGLFHSVTLCHHSAHLRIENVVSLVLQQNFEVAMKLQTSVKSEDNFYTDLNGFQMIHRRYFSKLPTQANFYPMPGAAFVEDQSSRVSLLGNQALGVGSLEPGSLEIIMDRRLLQDDDRGLQQGVTDNLRTSSVFNLFVEALSSSDSEAGNRRIAFHSLPAHAASLMLHYPIITMLIDRTIQTKETYSALTASFPCNIHVVTFRTSVSSSSYESHMRPPHHTSSSTKALVLHRLAADCRSNVFYGGKCNVTAEKISPLSYFTHKPVTMREASLTALYDYGPQNVLNLRPMEVKTVLFDYV